MRTLLTTLALALTAAAASAAEVKYADLYQKVKAGDVCLVAVGTKGIGDRCLTLADPPPAVASGVYVCFAEAGEPKWRCVEVAAVPTMIALPQPVFGGCPGGVCPTCPGGVCR